MSAENIDRQDPEDRAPENCGEIVECITSRLVHEYEIWKRVIQVMMFTLLDMH